MKAHQFTDSHGLRYQLFRRDDSDGQSVHLEFGLLRNMNLDEMFATHKVPEQVKSSCRLESARAMGVEGIYVDDAKEGEAFPISDDDLVLVSTGDTSDSFIPGSVTVADGVVLLRKDVRSEAANIFLCIILLIGGLRSSMYFSFGVQWLDLGIIGIPIPLFFLPALTLAAYVLHSIYDTKYFVERDCIRAEHGLASFQSIETRIDYVHVRGAEVHQNILDRMFDVGTLKVGSAMQATAEVVFSGIRHPEKWEKHILDQARGIQRRDADPRTSE